MIWVAKGEEEILIKFLDVFVKSEYEGIRFIGIMSLFRKKGNYIDLKKFIVIFIFYKN